MAAWLRIACSAALHATLATAPAAALQWHHPGTLKQGISPAGSDALTPTVAVADQGHAVAAWMQWHGVTWHIFKSERACLTCPWHHPAPGASISPAAAYADMPVAAAGGRGDMVIAWRQFDGTDYRIFLSERRAGVWKHPKDLGDAFSLPGSKAEAAKVAMDAKGRTVVAWQQYRSGVNEIFVATWAGGVWTKPAGLWDHLSHAAGPAVWPQVAMAASGRAAVTWYQGEAEDSAVFGRFFNGFGWSPLGPLLGCQAPDDALSLPATAGRYAGVALSAKGGVVLAWAQPDDGHEDQVFLRGALDGQPWGPLDYGDHISPDAGPVAMPGMAEGQRVGLDDNGDVVLAWIQGASSGSARVLVAELRNGVWSTPGGMQDSLSPDPSDAHDLVLALNPAGGDAAIAWIGRDAMGLPQLFLRHHAAGVAGWDAPVGPIGAPGPLGGWINPQNTEFVGVMAPSLAMNRSNRALLAWSQTDGTDRRIYLSRFD